MAEFISAFERVTGEHVLFSRETQSLLQGTDFALRQPLEVPPEKVYSVFQDVMITHRFVMMDVRRAEPRMMVVASLDSSQRAQLKQAALYVPIEHLHEYAEDTAMLVQTVIELPNVDVRTMGAPMRQLVVDPNTMQIVPLPETNQLILTGFADEMNQFVHLLQRIDENSARVKERRRLEAEQNPPDPIPETEGEGS